MRLTVKDIKDILTSKMIDHQQLKVVKLRKDSQYLEIKLELKDVNI